MADSEREGRDYLLKVKWILTLAFVSFILYQWYTAPIQGENVQNNESGFPPNNLPPTAEPLVNTVPTPQPLASNLPEGRDPQPTGVGVQPTQEVTFDDVINATEPIPIVDLQTQEERFTYFQPMYENLILICNQNYNVPNNPDSLKHMLALIRNTYVGKYGEIKLVYSSDFDPIFVQYGFDIQEKKQSVLAQICVGQTILHQAITTQKSVIGGFSEYNGGALAGYWWNQYVLTLSSDGQFNENAEAAAIAYLKYKTIDSDQNYQRLRDEYRQHLVDQGYDSQKIDEIVARVETFLHGVASDLYP